ncbi:MAG TPA: phasin family protein [Arenicellales bacterium]|nr:phasin family protein [Arenicellales bacterium]
MQQDFVNTMNNFSKTAVDAAKTLGELNAKIAEQVIERQLAAANLFVEGSVNQAKLAQETKDVKEYWSKQAALTDEYAGKAMDLAKQNVELAQQFGEQYKDWFEKGFAQANEAAGEVTKQVQESAKKAQASAKKAASA